MEYAGACIHVDPMPSTLIPIEPTLGPSESNYISAGTVLIIM